MVVYLYCSTCLSFNRLWDTANLLNPLIQTISHHNEFTYSVDFSVHQKGLVSLLTSLPPSSSLSLSLVSLVPLSFSLPVATLLQSFYPHLMLSLSSHPFPFPSLLSTKSQYYYDSTGSLAKFHQK